MKTIIAVAFICVGCGTASAECWKVANMKGSSIRSEQNYAITSDGFSDVFEITIAGNAGSVQPSNLKCQPSSKRMLVCTEATGEQSVVETWAVDPNGKKAFHTKSISGYGSFDGANLFVGQVIGACGKG